MERKKDKKKINNIEDLSWKEVDDIINEIVFRCKNCSNKVKNPCVRGTDKFKNCENRKI